MIIFESKDAKIFESYQPFKDFFHQDHRGNTVPDIKKIKWLATSHDFVIANCSTEHWDSNDSFPFTRYLHDIFHDCNVENFIILTHDPGYESLSHRILYFPFWFWKRSLSPLICPDLLSKPTYLISSLSGQPRPFRIANYLAMRSKLYLTECVINIWYHYRDTDGYDDGLILTEKENLQWQTLQKSMQIQGKDGFDGFDPLGEILGVTHPAWSDSCLNLVNESTVKNRIFITEKTWKPIMSGQMFMIFGNAGTVAELRRLGFDVFDDIIDHSYDLEPDARCRLNKIHTELDRLVDSDLRGKMMLTVQRRIENWKKFQEHKIVDTYLHSIRNILSL